jgi:hypothetical protein
MATWIAHLRIAEYFINNYTLLNNKDFLAGNIAPDCGVPNEDWSRFSPDKNISHWILDGKNIDAEDFKIKYLNKKDDKFCFYLGYYFHLLADIEWDKLFQRKKLEPVYYNGLNKDKNFIRTIKKDWYGQDHLYLKNNPSSIFFTMFSKINEYENNYFDFYPKDAFTSRIKYITEFYLNADEDCEREYPYLKKEEMDNFVDNTINTLEKTYRKLELI